MNDAIMNTPTLSDEEQRKLANYDKQYLQLLKETNQQFASLSPEEKFKAVTEAVTNDPNPTTLVPITRPKEQRESYWENNGVFIKNEPTSANGSSSSQPGQPLCAESNK